MPRKPLEVRFLEKIEKTYHCWNWVSAKIETGYGTFWVGGKRRMMYAHRLMWELCHGPIPENKIIMHKCDNTSCVNPAHLCLGTNKDNSQDAKAKKRNAFGTSNGAVRFSENTARRILLIGDTVPAKKIADALGTGKTHVLETRKNKRWAHVKYVPGNNFGFPQPERMAA